MEIYQLAYQRYYLVYIQIKAELPGFHFSSCKLKITQDINMNKLIKTTCLKKRREFVHLRENSAFKSHILPLPVLILPSAFTIGH